MPPLSRIRAQCPLSIVVAGTARRIVIAAVLAFSTVAFAQERLPPVDLLPPLPADGSTLTTVEDRLQALEEAHTRDANRYDSLFSENKRLTEQIESLSKQSPRAVRSYNDQPEDIRTDEPEAATKDKPTNSLFGEGFKWATKDGEYDLVFHNETQLEVRTYAQAHSDPVDQVGFFVPRMRMIFNGSLTDPIEYAVSINKGFGDLDLLDAYMNFNYDKRFQVRIGRYRVPFMYDWYALSNQFLPTPERSVFAINYGYNRNVAVMLHGELGEDLAEYAVAFANGPRNQYFDFNADKDVMAYINYRPFANCEECKWLNHWNIGASMAYGIQDQRPRPIDFRTSLNATDSEGALYAAPSFLELNAGVTEQGPRNLGELHMAYFYKQLSVMGAWDTGYNSYALGAGPVKVPTRGYHVQFGYFLTGEEITRRTFVDPIHPFDRRKGKCGNGAWEIQARYDDFSVDRNIFTSGFADPNEWTNHVRTVDAGLNWYLNKYTKIYWDWQHAMYSNPIPYRPGGVQKTSDLFWLRCQIYF